MKSNITQFPEDVFTRVHGCQNASQRQHNSSICNNKKPVDSINLKDCLLTSRSILGSSLSCSRGQSDRLRILRGWRAAKVDQKIPSGATAWGDRGAKQLMGCWRAG